VHDDLLSETVQRIQKGVDSYVDRGPGTLRSWCFKIADRVVLDLWRGRLHSIQDGLVGQPELVSFAEIEERFTQDCMVRDDTDYTAIVSSSTASSPIISERAKVLWEAFESLTSVDQAIIWCRAVHDDPDAYIAHITGKPPEHIRKLRSKALKKLRKRFERLLEARRLAS
jgi:RNA polymerase sigma factor (sigma-70 family)